MREPGAASDSALIAGFLAGDEGSFRALHSRHAPRLRAVIMRLLGGSRSEVDDACQDAWMAACRSMASFRGDSLFSTWLTTIGLRVARVRLARMHASFVMVEDIDGFESAAVVLSVVTEDASFKHGLIDLERAIAALPAHQRVILVLHDIEGFTHEEIAHELGCAVGTSKGTLSRARNAIREVMLEGAGK